LASKAAILPKTIRRIALAPEIRIDMPIIIPFERARALVISSQGFSSLGPPKLMLRIPNYFSLNSSKQ
jgi:hypothetical protein